MNILTYFLTYFLEKFRKILSVLAKDGKRKKALKILGFPAKSRLWKMADGVGFEPYENTSVKAFIKNMTYF